MNALILISLILGSNAFLEAEHQDRSPNPTNERIVFAQMLLDQELPSTRRWFNILRSVYGGAAALNAVLALIDEEGQVSHITHASKASLGLIRAFADPYVPTYASEILAAMPSSTSEEEKVKLAKAEALLEKGARQAIHRLSWKGRILPGIVHIIGGLVIWRYQDSWERGLISTLVGQTVTEITARTQPGGIIKAWEKYQNKYLRNDNLPEEPKVSFFMVPTPLGFQAGLHF
jgi:hypothetical protein